MVTIGIVLLSGMLGAPAVTANPARAAFEEAVSYFHSEAYEEALALFRKAYDLSGGRPSTVKGMAQCERALMRYSQAIQHFEEYLRSEPDDADRVKKTIALLKRKAAQQTEATAGPPRERPRRTRTSAPTAPTDQADRTAVLDLRARAPAAPPAPAQSIAGRAPEEPSEDSILSSPILWVAVAAVAIAGGVTVGVLVGSGGGDPYGGNTGEIFGP